MGLSIPFFWKKGFQLELKRVAFPYLICIWDSFIVVRWVKSSLEEFNENRWWKIFFINNVRPLNQVHTLPCHIRKNTRLASDLRKVEPLNTIYIASLSRISGMGQHNSIVNLVIHRLIQ